jgi:hypothetical protein
MAASHSHTEGVQRENESLKQASHACCGAGHW